MDIIQKLQSYKKGFLMNANISEYLGIAAYKNEYIEIYEYYSGEGKFIIEENEKVASVLNDFDFTEKMFFDWVEQRKFELSDKEHIKDFKKFETVLMSANDFKEYRPHIFYKNACIEDIKIKSLLSDDGRKRHRCGNCGYPYFYSSQIFEYSGGENGLEASSYNADIEISCGCCGRIVKNPKLFIGGMHE